jgi:hypothetical protein
LDLPFKKPKVFGEDTESLRPIFLPIRMIKILVENFRDGIPTNLVPQSSTLKELTKNSLTMKATLKHLTMSTIFSLSQFTQPTLVIICGKDQSLIRMIRLKLNLNLNSGRVIKMIITTLSKKLGSISLIEKKILTLLSIQKLRNLINHLKRSLTRSRKD